MRRIRLFPVLAGAGLLAVAGVCAQEPGQRAGVLVVAVEPDSPAANAGLVRGDIILSMAGVTVNSVPELVAVLEEHSGAQVEVRFRHGDDLRTASIDLGDGSNATWLGIEPESSDLLFSLRERLRSVWPENFKLTFTAVAGARLTAVVAAGPAAAAGLQAGDIITHLDGVPVAAAAALTERVAAAAPGARIAMRLLRDGSEQETTVTLGRRPDGDGAFLGVRYAPWFSGAPWQRRGQGGESTPRLRLNIGDLLRI